MFAKEMAKENTEGKQTIFHSMFRQSAIKHFTYFSSCHNTKHTFIQYSTIPLDLFARSLLPSPSPSCGPLSSPHFPPHPFHSLPLEVGPVKLS